METPGKDYRILAIVGDRGRDVVQSGRIMSPGMFEKLEIFVLYFVEQIAGSSLCYTPVIRSRAGCRVTVLRDRRRWIPPWSGTFPDGLSAEMRPRFTSQDGH
jgi:hypothetical protein